MKITDIELNCRGDADIVLSDADEAEILFVKSPSMYTAGAERKYIRGKAVIICSSEVIGKIRSLSERVLKYDRIRVQLSVADRQYISSLDIACNTPNEIYDDGILNSVLKNMKDISIAGNAHSREFMELSVKMILLLAGGRTQENEKARSIPHYSKLKTIREKLYEHPEWRWETEGICYELDISRTYFHRIYSEAFGVGFRQDAIDSRIRMSCGLLLTTNLSISEISEKCGYESESYFMKQFRMRKGCTPTEYRRINENASLENLLKKGGEEEINE